MLEESHIKDCNGSRDLEDEEDEYKLKPIYK